MGLLLLLIFLLTLGYLGYFAMPGSRRPNAYGLGRRITAGYLGLSSLFILLLILSHTLFLGADAHRKVRHIEYRGVAVTIPSITGDTNNVRVSGSVIDGDSPVKRAFRWFALPSGSTIDLRPDQTDGKRIASYRVEAHQCPEVVRLNRVCVNDVVGGWIPTGQTAPFQVKKVSGGDKPIEFKLSAASGQVKLAESYDKEAPDPVGVVDRISLRGLCTQSGALELRKALQDLDDGRGAPLLDGVEIVRYRRADGDSAIGLVYAIDPSVLNAKGADADDALAVIASGMRGEKATPSIGDRNGVFRLEIYGSDSRSALLLPTKEMPTVGGHSQLRFQFDPPRAYPLPPSTVGSNIQLSSADLGQDTDGYLFDTGNLNEGVLANATIRPDGSSMNVFDNESATNGLVNANEDQVLGNGAVAPIYALADPLKGAGSAWLLPALGLILGLLFSVASLGKTLPGLGKRQRRAPINVAPAHPAFVLWVVATAILAVRVVLAFRVSILPPFNMDAVSAASFRGGWTKAWFPALVLPPVLGALTIAVVRAKQPFAAQEWTEKVGTAASKALRQVAERPWWFLSRASYGAAFGLGFLMLLQKIVHFPMPDMVLVGVMLVILGLVFDGVGEARDEDLAEGTAEGDTAQTRLAGLAEKNKWVSNLLSKRRFWERNPLLWLASAELLFLDPGSFLFFVPVALALCAGGIIAALGQSPATVDAAARAKALRSSALIGFAMAVILGGIFFAAPIGSRLLVDPLAGKFVKNAAFPYRLTATDPSRAEHLLVDPDTRRGVFEPHHMQETLHQRWEMIAYQRANGAGYFGAPLSNVGMTYPTTLSDAAFSVYLVGEHGDLAALMTIGLLLLLSLAVFRAAWMAACSRNQKANARGLYAVAGVFGCTAVYMGLANLWVVPFTGQNVPMLSLNSWKDLLLNGALLVSAVLLIGFPGSWGSQNEPAARKTAGPFRAAWWAFPALLGFGWVALGICLFATNGSSSQSFNLSQATVGVIQQTITEANQQARERQVSLEATPAVQGASTFVRSMVNRFDSGEITQTPLIEGRSSTSSVAVNRHFFLLKSPFEHDYGVPWHGSLLAAGKIRRHQLVVGGSRLPITLELGAGPGSLNLGQAVRAQVVQSIDFKQIVSKRPRRTVDYGGLKLDGDKVLLRWKDFGKPGAILVNGKRPDLKRNELEIKESDIVSLEYTGPDGVPQKLSLHYLGATENKLASVVWRNGRFTRTYPQGADFPLAYTIGEIGDEVTRGGKSPKQDVSLSLDIQLQRDLQGELTRWARERGRLIDRGETSADGLPFTAVSVLDSSNGQIRALASLPQCDPRDDFATVEDRFQNEADAQTASRSSWAFVNRTIGSTIKPLSFSALNSQLDGKDFDLTRLHVDEEVAVETYTDSEGRERHAYRKLGDIHLKIGKSLGSKEHPRSDVDMFTYLKDSRTWPAIVTSTIGLVSDRSHPNTMHDELQRILTPSGGGPLSMGPTRMAFSPGAALRRLFGNQTQTVSSIELADTAYFRGIEDCYGPSVVPFNTNESNRWDDGLSKQFLAPFDLTGVQNQSLKNLGLPAVHWADTTAMTDFDGQLLRYFFGGGECRWNAVTMAANFARITTGRRVQPTLSAAAQETIDKMPSPIDSFSWRKEHILGPLFQITTIPAADVDQIRGTVSHAGYRIAMKTGTIDDATKKNPMESEMLMFTVGRYNESTGFVPGHCISGFFSIRAAKHAEGDVMVKGDLIKRVMPILVGYLKRLENPLH